MGIWIKEKKVKFSGWITRKRTKKINKIKWGRSGAKQNKQGSYVYWEIYAIPVFLSLTTTPIHIYIIIGELNCPISICTSNCNCTLA